MLMPFERNLLGTDPPRRSEISVRLMLSEEIENLVSVCRMYMGPGVAEIKTVCRVRNFNPEGFFAVVRTLPGQVDPYVVGCYVHLMLSQAGLDALLDGTFVGHNPDLSHLCSQLDQPAAIYGWGAVAPGVNRWARPLVDKIMGGPRYERLGFYARAWTEGGLRGLMKMGCVPVDQTAAARIGSLMFKPRRANAGVEMVA